MALSNKLLEVMVFSGVMTVWTVLFSSLYEEMFSDGAYGLGEIYLGFTIPSIFATVLSYFLIKRIQANR